MLLTPDGLLKLADLGVAGLLKGGSSAMRIGTPQYMAPGARCRGMTTWAAAAAARAALLAHPAGPLLGHLSPPRPTRSTSHAEMHRREPYSFSADIWSLGCTLHELCTGMPLFAAGSDEGARARVLAAHGPPPRLPAAYSEELNALVATMLAPDPGARPSAEALLHEGPLLGCGSAGLPPQLAGYLPLAVQRSLHGGEVLPPIEVPASAAHFHTLNEVLPQPRYSLDGEAGVLGIIRRWVGGGAGGRASDGPPSLVPACPLIQPHACASSTHAAPMRFSQSVHPAVRTWCIPLMLVAWGIPRARRVAAGTTC